MDSSVYGSPHAVLEVRVRYETKTMNQNLTKGIEIRVLNLLNRRASVMQWTCVRLGSGEPDSDPCSPKS